MIKKMVGEMTGTSDIGTIIDASQFNLTQSDDYIFNEDNEQIHFLIQSSKDEYCFTNMALIHVDGESAVSTKRQVKRYPYATSFIDYVGIETAGKMDRDCEIKFTINNVNYSIDVIKDQIDLLKDLYKSLSAISSLQKIAIDDETLNNESIGLAIDVYRTARNNEVTAATIKEVMEMLYESKHNARIGVRREDYKEVFEKYINN